MRGEREQSWNQFSHRCCEKKGNSYIASALHHQYGNGFQIQGNKYAGVCNTQISEDNVWGKKVCLRSQQRQYLGKDAWWKPRPSVGYELAGKSSQLGKACLRSESFSCAPPTPAPRKDGRKHSLPEASMVEPGGFWQFPELMKCVRGCQTQGREACPISTESGNKRCLPYDKGQPLPSLGLSSFLWGKTRLRPRRGRLPSAL